MSYRPSSGGPVSRSGRGGSRRLGQLPVLNGRDELRGVFGMNMLPPSPAKPNAGLVFDRFLRIWQSDVALVKERLEPLRQFVEDYEKCQGCFEPRL